MGRKGDIISKVIGVRTPIKLYTKLLNESSDKGISLSEYCVMIFTGLNQKNQDDEIRLIKMAEQVSENTKIINELKRHNEQLNQELIKCSEHNTILEEEYTKEKEKAKVFHEVMREVNAELKEYKEKYPKK